MSNRIKWDSHHGPAVNVKDNGRYDHDLPEDEAQAIWDEVAEGFWSDAEALAQEFDYAGVYGEGRMGGWLVPHYARGSNIRAWTDHLGSDEPEYQEEVARFERFGAAVVELLEEAQAYCRERIGEAQRDRDEAAALLERGTPGRGF